MIIRLHPETPEKRNMQKIAEVFQKGGILVYPTDSGYSLGCNALNMKAVQRLYHLKRAMKKYIMAMMFHEFSDITDFAKVDNFAFRYMKHLFPGPYTIILPATNKGRKTLGVKRPEIGVRMPDHIFTRTLGGFCPEPILNTAAKLTEDDVYVEAAELEAKLGKQVDLVVDMGAIPIRPTTVISLVNGEPEIIREGVGPIP